MAMAVNLLLGSADSPRETLLDPETERQIEDSRERVEQRLGHRERRVEATYAIGFIAAAAAMALLMPWERQLSLAPTAALVAAYAIASRIKFEVGPCYTNPTQLVLVPMLFFLPVACVPAAVALSNVLGEIPEYARGGRHPERALVSMADSWYAVGPALVIGLAATTGPQLDHWPLYLGALAAQFAFDAATTTPREWLGMGVPPRSQVSSAGWTFAVDALLSPVGLAAALATMEAELSLLLVLPVAVLLLIFASERSQRLESVLQLSDAYRGTTALLAELVEFDDEYTGLHSQGVVDLSLHVGDRLGLSPRRRRTLEFAALLHDIGKMAVPKDIINKRGPLTSGEWAVMRGHTLDGERMLRRVGGTLGEVGAIVRSSHERWDGKGYPDGLAGDGIPVEARIVSCCDAFNAMTTDRSYRPAMPLERALQELVDNSGTQFDPDVADVLAEIVAPAERAPA